MVIRPLRIIIPAIATPRRIPSTLDRLQTMPFITPSPARLVDPNPGVIRTFASVTARVVRTTAHRSQGERAADTGYHLRHGRGQAGGDGPEGGEVDGEEAQAAFEVGPEDCFGVFDCCASVRVRVFFIDSWVVRMPGLIAVRRNQVPSPLSP